MQNIVDTNSTDAKKPCYDDWRKKETYPVSTIVLERKQAH